MLTFAVVRRQALSKWPILGVVALSIVIAVAIPTDTSASHDFSDVSTGFIFHEEISAIAGAGITTGCAVGKYCGGDPVSRLAMAAFMHRGFGRAAMDNTLAHDTIVDLDVVVPIGDVTIEVPGAGASATQFVEVRGQVAVTDTSLGCPCFVLATPFDTTTFELAAISFYDLVGFIDTIEASWVFTANPGAHTYEMRLITESVLDLSLSDLVLTATTYPFGAAGGTTLSATSEVRSASIALASAGEAEHRITQELEELSSKRR